MQLDADLQGPELVLRVRDDGQGITETLLPHIFDLFVQASRSLDRSQGGLGIGLTLVRHLVELHGGTVSASSAGPGHGSVFLVRMPVVCEKPELPEPEVRAPARPRAPVRVLLVEDNPDAAETMVELLELWGHPTCLCDSGAEALRVAPQFRPEVVLLDIGLPEMDGFEVARRLRRLPVGPGLCLIAVSGYGQDRDRLLAAQAGFDLHLTKPVDPHVLRDTLAAVAASRPAG